MIMEEEEDVVEGVGEGEGLEAAETARRVETIKSIWGSGRGWTR